VERDEHRTPILVAVSYLVASVMLLAATGHLAHPDQLAASTSDAEGYLAYARALLGRGEVDALTRSLRPVGYPLFLAGIELLHPRGGMLLLGAQLLLNAASLVVVHRAVRVLGGSRTVARVAMAVMGVNLSLVFLSPHALAEPLGVTLMALVVLGLARYARDRVPRHRIGVLALLAVLVVVKPIALPFLLGWLLIAVIGAFRSPVTATDGDPPRGGPGPWLQLAWIALALVPVGAQLAVTGATLGRPVISEAGSYNLSRNLIPLVAGIDETRRGFELDDPRADAVREAHPTPMDQLGYLVRHPASSLRAGVFLVQQNLLTGSIFVAYPASAVDRPLVAEGLGWIARIVNGLLACAHVVVALSLRGGRVAFTPEVRRFTAPALILGASILVLSLMTYHQGDRVVLLALPVWAVAYPLLLRPGSDPGPAATTRVPPGAPSGGT